MPEFTICPADHGSSLIRNAGGDLIGWWVRPTDVGRMSTAVFLLTERGGRDRLGAARTKPQVLRLLARRFPAQ